MSWFNIGDEDHKDPGFRHVGLAAFGLCAAAGSYCMENLTDGRVPVWFVKSWPGGPQAAARLVTEEKWVPVDGGDYQFIEWKKELTRDYVLEARKKAAAKKRRQRSMSPGTPGGTRTGTCKGTGW